MKYVKNAKLKLYTLNVMQLNKCVSWLALQYSALETNAKIMKIVYLKR